MALIIVEGPDLAGKSTLVEAINVALRKLDDCDVQVMHKGPPIEHALREYEGPLMAYRPSTGRHVICDRWHLGERVYPELHDRQSTLDGPVWHHVELFLRSRGALLVHLTADDDTLLYRRAGRDELAHELNLTARDLFARRAVESSLHRMTFHAETLVRDVESAAHLVVASAVTAERSTARLNQLATYVGSQAPKLLLFGDVRANGPQAMHLDLAGDVPAFMPFRATSGHYLLTALGDQVSRFGIGLVNACDVDDPWTTWRTLGYPEAVALGRNAERALEKAEVKHRVVPHPQYRRRFHHRDLAEYATMILNGGNSEWNIG